MPELIAVHNRDGVEVLAALADGSVDLVVADPPYGLGKDYGNPSDHMALAEYLTWKQ